MTRVADRASDPVAVAQLAEAAAASDREEEVLPVVRDAARASDDRRLWHWTGLLERAIDRRDRALPAFERACRLAPADPVAAHALARTRLEAGLPAVDAFAAAHALAPLDGDILLGASAALLADGAVDQAIAMLAAQCRAHPGWYTGHAELAQLRWVSRDHAGCTASYEAALVAAPRDPSLWLGIVDVHARAGAWDAALDAVARARAALGALDRLDLHEATALSETGAWQAADAAFARTVALADPAAEVRRVRHALRLDRLEPAIDRIEPMVARSDGAAMWPYAAIAWRLSGDPRLAWLEADGLVRVEDILGELPSLDRLATVLNHHHGRSGEQLDQSVRGGTQTAGALLARIEPELMAVRDTIARAVTRYVAALPAADGRHPTVSARRDRPPRFAGSWSVRLRAGGRHANHVHSAGWISSALYVALPGGEPGEGWLTLGEPQAELGLALAPNRTIEPRPGRLVLFPSWMWHGTTPFARGERLSIAFDVRHPRG